MVVRSDVVLWDAGRTGSATRQRAEVSHMQQRTLKQQRTSRPLYACELHAHLLYAKRWYGALSRPIRRCVSPRSSHLLTIAALSSVGMRCWESMSWFTTAQHGFPQLADHRARLT